MVIGGDACLQDLLGRGTHGASDLIMSTTVLPATWSNGGALTSGPVRKGMREIP